MPRNDITLQCHDCGDTTNRPSHCPYTGHRHSEGWVYKCKCGGDMVEVAYREGGACAFMVPEPGEPWVSVKDYPDKPNFIELNRNRLLPEKDVTYEIQVLRYTCGMWLTRASAKTEGLARLIYEAMLKFKNYGDQIRIRKIGNNKYVEETIDESK